MEQDQAYPIAQKGPRGVAGHGVRHHSGPLVQGPDRYLAVPDEADIVVVMRATKPDHGLPGGDIAVDAAQRGRDCTPVAVPDRHQDSLDDFGAGAANGADRRQLQARRHLAELQDLRRPTRSA